MMNKSELLNEAKKAKSIEELKQMAADSSITLTEEEAKFYFSLVNDKEGELSLEELDAAVGGADHEMTKNPGKPACENYRCNTCGSPKAGKESCPNNCGGTWHTPHEARCSNCRNYEISKAIPHEYYENICPLYSSSC